MYAYINDVIYHMYNMLYIVGTCEYYIHYKMRNVSSVLIEYIYLTDDV